MTVLEVTSEEWMQRGECNGMNPDLFFPTVGENKAVAAAKKVCAQCDVREECLEYALQTRQMHGIWGGLSEKERRRIRQQRSRRGSALCAKCGARFQMRSNGHKFCSDGCALLGQRERQKRWEATRG